jgi:hypothetical protein
MQIGQLVRFDYFTSLLRMYMKGLTLLETFAWSSRMQEPLLDICRKYICPSLALYTIADCILIWKLSMEMNVKL